MRANISRDNKSWAPVASKRSQLLKENVNPSNVVVIATNYFDAPDFEVQN